MSQMNEIDRIAFKKYIGWVMRNMSLKNSDKLQDMGLVKRIIYQAKEEAKRECNEYKEATQYQDDDEIF